MSTAGRRRAQDWRADRRTSSTELKATAWKPSTGSFEALRLYNEGVQLTQQGTHQEALKRFEAATKQDGNFALAFSALGRSLRIARIRRRGRAGLAPAMSLATRCRRRKST